MPVASRESDMPTEFIWKHGGSNVTLTGTFDGWNKSIKMRRDQFGIFRVTIPLDPTVPWIFKFVVDGVWRCSMDLPTVTDQAGNVNNILPPLSEKKKKLDC